MGTGKRGEGGALEADLRVLRRHAGRVVTRTQVLQDVQPGRRLAQDQGQQGQERDQRSAGGSQGAYLCRVAIL